MSTISMKQLLEAGVHFGHQTRNWNPKMAPFIFTARNGIHILNLEETDRRIKAAYEKIREIASTGKSILFVGTKKQAAKVIEEEAVRANAFFVSNRWLGGMLTNFKTIRTRVERLNKLYQMEKMGEFNLLTKKEAAKLVEERAKLEKNLGGVKHMTGLPGAIFVVDPKTEHLAVKEARTCKIPLIGIVDTNCDPDDVDFVIPANDDAMSSVKLIVASMADAVIEGREGVAPVREEEKPAEGEQA